MNEEKIVLKKEKEVKAVQPVFIDIEQHKQLLELKNETGIPLRRIIAKFIEFGFEHVEVISDGEL
ncbi:hypothetical protein AB6834_02510 [Carnobacterium divergens]|uniref:hypothetical protein n=1 Tax=Carnobacterium divergens TaxID=2748 RepID=UPI0039BEBE22